MVKRRRRKRGGDRERLKQQNKKGAATKVGAGKGNGQRKKTRKTQKSKTQTHGSLNTGLQSPHIASAVLSAIGLGSTNSQSIKGAISCALASSRSRISFANAPGIKFDATETTPAADIPSPWCRAAWASSSFPDQHRTPRAA